MFWKDIGVDNWASGQPFLRLTGGAARRMEMLVPEGRVARIDLSLTDEPPYAHAMVIISADTDEERTLRPSP